jgi:hypothetical protein
MREHGPDFFPRQHQRHPFSLLCPLHSFDSAKLFLQNLTEQKLDGAKGLVLRGRLHMPISGQILEKVADLLLNKCRRILFLEADEMPNPLEICLFGSETITFQTDSFADLIEEGDIQLPFVRCITFRRSVPVAW